MRVCDCEHRLCGDGMIVTDKCDVSASIGVVVAMQAFQTIRMWCICEHRLSATSIFLSNYGVTGAVWWKDHCPPCGVSVSVSIG